jgi:hypothetical protein
MHSLLDAIESPQVREETAQFYSLIEREGVARGLSEVPNLEPIMVRCGAARPPASPLCARL